MKTLKYVLIFALLCLNVWLFYAYSKKSYKNELCNKAFILSQHNNLKKENELKSFQIIDIDNSGKYLNIDIEKFVDSDDFNFF